LIGEAVATLVDKQMKAGMHQVRWSAQHLASGIYFYTITAGKFTRTKKMLLLK
jgi:hypothetical protein